MGRPGCLFISLFPIAIGSTIGWFQGDRMWMYAVLSIVLWSFLKACSRWDWIEMNQLLARRGDPQLTRRQYIPMQTAWNLGKTSLMVIIPILITTHVTLPLSGATSGRRHYSEAAKFSGQAVEIINQAAPTGRLTPEQFERLRNLNEKALKEALLVDRKTLESIAPGTADAYREMYCKSLEVFLAATERGKMDPLKVRQSQDLHDRWVDWISARIK